MGRCLIVLCLFTKFFRVRAKIYDKYPLQTALKIADKEFFPNLHAILLSILTLPVGSVCCERSFSSLRRLKT